MGKSYKGIFSVLILGFLFQSPLLAQEVQRQGAISVEEQSVTEDLNGTAIVPALNANQGMIRLTVRRNNYFNIQDVARWIRNNEMSFDRVNIETSNIIVRNDDSIQLRFTQEFIGTSETVQRRVQIRHPEGHFENYFDFAQFYKQKVVNLELAVARAPQFAEEFIPRGTLEIITNENQAEVVVFDARGQRVQDRFIIGAAPSGEGYIAEFLNIPIGEYTVRVTKEGRQTITLNQVNVQNNQTTRERVELARDDLTAGLGRIIIDTNLQDVDIEIRDQTRGTREVQSLFAGYMNREFQPGTYQLRLEPQGFDPTIVNVELNAGQTFQEQVTMIRNAPVESLAFTSDPSNAEVIINGEYAGNTPFTIFEQPREEMVVELRLNRHRTVVDTLLLYSEIDFTYFEELQENYIRIDPSPSAYVYIDGEARDYSPITITSPEEREYSIRLVAPNYVTVDTTFDMSSEMVAYLNPILSFEMANVRINPERPAIPIRIEIEGENYSEVFENTASRELSMPYGSYEMTFSRNGFKDVTRTVRINDRNQVVPYDLEPKKKGVSILMSALIPGTGQMYWNNNKRGWMFMLAFAGIGTYSYLELSNYDNLLSDYNETVNAYNTGSNPTFVTEQGALMENQFAALNEQKATVDNLLMIAVGVYGLNLIDRILFTRAPNRIYQRERVGSSAMNVSMGATPGGISLKLNF